MNNQNAKIPKLAIFDFDGTLTLRDTTILFIFHCAGIWRGSLYFFLNVPFILMGIWGWMDWKSVKERIFVSAFGNSHVNQLQNSGDDFSVNKIPRILNPTVYHEMKKLQANGFEVALLTASCSVWLCKWCEIENVKLLSTELEIVDDVYTGKIQGENCFGFEKVNKLRSVYKLENVEETVAWGNHKSDLHFMKLANKAYWVNGTEIILLKHEV